MSFNSCDGHLVKIAIQVPDYLNILFNKYWQWTCKQDIMLIIYKMLRK